MKAILLALLLIQGTPSPRTGTGVVTGRILSLDGTPAVGVRVAAVPVPDSAVPAGPPVLSSIGQTDSAGNYRLENIPAGRYYITAGLVDRPIYFPGSDAPTSSSIINVTAAASVTGVDFKLQRAVALKVSGRVLGNAVAQVSPARPRVTLLPRTPAVQPPYPSALLRSDLTYEVANVLPGTYSVQLTGMGTLTMKETVLITVADKDLAGIDLAMVDTGVTSKREGLVEAWSLAGNWAGIVANDKGGTLYASGLRGRSEIDASGKVVSEVSFPRGTKWRLTRSPDTPDPAFIMFGFNNVVQALDLTGKVLWAYPDSPTAGASINDVWPVDLDGDQLDEIVLGFNGGTGVHVLDSRGKLLWKSTIVGNIWNVAAGDVRGNGKPQAVTTSAAGKVHIWADDGSGKVDLDPGVYANMVRVGRLSESDPAATIFAGGTVSDNSAAVMAALTADGTKKWSLQFPGTSRPSISSALLAAGKPWLAIALSTGEAHVIDATRGTVIATVDGQGQSAQVSWMRGKDSAEPLLVISRGTSLTAFRISR
jgi:hypothetical protein